MWECVVWLRMESCENDKELPGFHKMQDTSRLHEQLLASQRVFIHWIVFYYYFYFHRGRMLQVQRTFCIRTARRRADDTVAAQRLVQPLSMHVLSLAAKKIRVVSVRSKDAVRFFGR